MLKCVGMKNKVNQFHQCFSRLFEQEITISHINVSELLKIFIMNIKKSI